MTHVLDPIFAMRSDTCSLGASGIMFDKAKCRGLC